MHTWGATRNKGNRALLRAWDALDTFSHFVLPTQGSQESFHLEIQYTSLRRHRGQSLVQFTPPAGYRRQKGASFGDTYRVLECQETVADPAAGGAVPADVGESLVQVAVRRAEGDLLDGLVHQQVLGGQGGQESGVNHSILICSFLSCFFVYSAGD